jgi:hypothetical protein|tara:strand:- start:231 stop:599 length:369 start_codon:yes stop_codon:yes gene_type:complete
MPAIELNEYYVELIGFLITLLVGLGIKDWAASFIKGLAFRFSGAFKEGDRVLLDNEPAMVVKIGLNESVFGIYSEAGYTWRYIPNQRIPMLKLAKVVDPELHPDTREEKARRIKDLLEKDGD